MPEVYYQVLLLFVPVSLQSATLLDVLFGPSPFFISKVSEHVWIYRLHNGALCVCKLAPDPTVGGTPWHGVLGISLPISVAGILELALGRGCQGSGSWERNGRPFSHCCLIHSHQRRVAGWLHGDVGEQAQTTRPKLYVGNREEWSLSHDCHGWKKEAGLVPAIPKS